MWHTNEARTNVRVRADVASNLAVFRVHPNGKLMPNVPNVPSVPGMPAVAYPRHIVTDDLITGESALSARFFERNAAHLIGRSTGAGVWPGDSDDPAAVRSFEAGQRALYDLKDANAAIAAYEGAVERDATYIKAWVALAIAYITDNALASLHRADDVLTFLASLSPGEYLTEEASGIIYQNRAYLNVHRYRQNGETDAALLTRADADYAVCDRRTAPERSRLEYLCPWAYVKLTRGEGEAARALWLRAAERADAIGASAILSEYAAKYAPLRAFV